jgi:glycosyltransferase involved in cell wall biosynthesis
MHRTLSIIVPCLNEQAAVAPFLSALWPVLEVTGYEFEIVFVDDGSEDATVAAILAQRAQYPQVRLVELTRNYGKEAALTAGLKYASGDAVIPMDCDLQDPPELIPEMIAQWEAGYKVVHAVRRSRHSDSWLKRTSAHAFYSLMDGITEVAIPPNCGDFRLLDRAVVEAILSFPERSRYMKGIMAAVGFKAATVEFDRLVRVAGKTKFSFWNLWNFALNAITGFSTWPLRIWTYIGATIALFSFVYAAWVITKTLAFGVVTPGFATLSCIILFLGGVQLIGLGVLGEYIGRLVAEAKQRPLYLVESIYGFEQPDAGNPAVVPIGNAHKKFQKRPG